MVPFANPIGLSQRVLGNHLGRFGLETGTNFNREWFDFADTIRYMHYIRLLFDSIRPSHRPRHSSEKIRGSMTMDAESNVELIRTALLTEIQAMSTNKEEQFLKKTLYSLAVTADIVLDLHCDSDAVMHMYTHDRLWPQMADLAAEMQSQCTLLAGASGGNPFDEAYSCPWAVLADKFPEFPIPMACQSATLELRGELDVRTLDDTSIPFIITDHSLSSLTGERRAGKQGCTGTLSISAMSRVHRYPPRVNNYENIVCMCLIFYHSAVHPDRPLSVPKLFRDASPLTGVDMIQATGAGIIAWYVKLRTI